MQVTKRPGERPLEEHLTMEDIERYCAFFSKTIKHIFSPFKKTPSLLKKVCSFAKKGFLKDKHDQYFDLAEENDSTLDDYMLYKNFEEKKELITNYLIDDYVPMFEKNIKSEGLDLFNLNINNDFNEEIKDNFVYSVEDALNEYLKTEDYQILKERFNRELNEKIKFSKELRNWAINKFFYEKGKSDFEAETKFTDVDKIDINKLTYKNFDLYIKENSNLISEKISQNIIELATNEENVLDVVKSKLDYEASTEDVMDANVPFTKYELIRYIEDENLRSIYIKGLERMKQFKLQNQIKEDNNVLKISNLEIAPKLPDIKNKSNEKIGIENYINSNIEEIEKNKDKIGER